MPLCASAVNYLVNKLLLLLLQLQFIRRERIGRILAASHKDGGCINVAISPG